MNHITFASLPRQDMLIEKIQKSTDRLNRDNLIRTRAYQIFWNRHPEIHWALLAAFVSRNAGYFMTDLSSPRGPIFPDRVKRVDLFHALERCNWLIFRDAFPQLLLYSISVRQQRDCFDLLPYLTRSAHMTGFWRDFYRKGDSSRLTRALIANEQAYIERRVVQHLRYRHVFRTAGYRAYAMLGGIGIVLPRTGPSPVYRMRRFTSLKARVRLGCTIYGGLFPSGRLEPRVAAWLRLGIRHSGSRADYAPERFASQAAAGRAFSPSLRSAWPVVCHAPDGEVEDDFGAALAAARVTRPKDRAVAGAAVTPGLHHQAAAPAVTGS